MPNGILGSRHSGFLRNNELIGSSSNLSYWVLNLVHLNCWGSFLGFGILRRPTSCIHAVVTPTLLLKK